MGTWGFITLFYLFLFVFGKNKILGEYEGGSRFDLFVVLFKIIVIVY